MIIIGDENDTRSFPLVNFTIIILAIVAFFVQFMYHGFDSNLFQYGLVPGRFLNHLDSTQLLTLMTSMFMHAGIMHIVGNLWFLYIFGDNVEEHFGHLNYLVFYLTCGIIGSLTYIGAHQASMEPAMGASGAISGVLGAYLLLFPEAKIKIWFGDYSVFLIGRTFKLPAWTLIGFWIVLQYVYLSLDVGTTAWHAHIGGFAAGLVIVMLFRLCGEAGPHSQEYQPLLQPAVSFTRAFLTSLLLIACLAVGGFYFFESRATRLEARSQDAGAEVGTTVESKRPSKGTETKKSHKRTHRHTRKDQSSKHKNSH
ncbi:MAG: rhomboid family intramembrane serine protease [Candidatus Obscuribacterales bacterium]|nr:rhomboid family intramembrane serine protease [Candidatus Obscuribacterales bacterium]